MVRRALQVKLAPLALPTAPLVQQVRLVLVFRETLDSLVPRGKRAKQAARDRLAEPLVLLVLRVPQALLRAKPEPLDLVDPQTEIRALRALQALLASVLQVPQAQESPVRPVLPAARVIPEPRRVPPDLPALPEHPRVRQALPDPLVLPEPRRALRVTLVRPVLG